MYLLKVARYVAQYDFEPAPDLVRFAARDAGNILDTPRNQWKEHLDRVLLGPGVIAGLQFLYDSRTLQFLMPEVASMVGFHESCPVHHKDIWDHTVKVIAKAEKNLVVRWAALMHDIGKVWTRQVTKQGKVHFFRHEELGALLFEGVAFRLRFDQESMNRVAYVIRNHSRVNLYEDNWTDSAIRRLMRDVGDYLPDLIAFSKADFTTKRAWREAELKRQMAELEQRIAAIREEDSRVPPLPSGLGNEMMGRFGLTPGPRIGELKRLLEAAIKDGTLAPYQESAVYLDWLAANASL
jgi:poly(A) polymerase